MFRAYNTRAYPANRQLLLDLLAVRQQMASILGFASWADLATANQMMGSAANMKNFIGELEQASRAGAEQEYEMVLAFARRQQPGLTALKSSDRGYWYEQYRRQAFDFDSQSVRPYFPYAPVEQGILETAARLFHVSFQRNQEAGRLASPGERLGRLRSGPAVWPFLPGHASPRRQRQVVQRSPADSRASQDASCRRRR